MDPLKTNDSPVQCGFCEQGHLRSMACPVCERVSAICDECELIWSDVEAVKKSPDDPSNSSFPRCPHCHAQEDAWIAIPRKNKD